MADKIEVIVDVENQKAISGFAKISQSIVVFNQGLELAKKGVAFFNKTLGAVIKQSAAFEQQMANVRSIAVLTDKAFADLNKEARRLGKETQFSAVEAGKAMEELSRAGFSVNKVLSITSDVLALASATGSDLAFSANVMAGALANFEKEGLKASEVADLMVKTAGASRQTFEDLAFSVNRSSSIAKGFNISFKELTVILGTLANQGAKAEIASTALNGALTRLANPVGEAKKALEKYGIALSDVNPLTNDFGDILDTIVTSGASTIDILKILGREAGPRLLQLFQKGSSALSEFAKKQDAANKASEAAAIRNATLEGKIKLFDSAVKDLNLTLGSNNIAQFLVDFGTLFVKTFTSDLEVIIKFSKTIAKFTSEMASRFQIMVVKIGLFFQELDLAITENLQRALRTAVKSLINFGIDISNIGENIVTIFDDVTLSGMLDAVLDFGNDIVKSITEIFNEFIQIVVRKIGGLVNAISKIPFSKILTDKLNSMLTSLNANLKKSESESSKVFGKINTSVTETIAKLKLLVESDEAFNAALKKTNAPLSRVITSTKKLIAELEARLKPALEKTSKATEDTAKIIGNDLTKSLDKATVSATALQKALVPPDLSGTAKAARDLSKELDKQKSAQDFAESQGLRVAKQVTGVSGAIAGFQAGGPMGAAIGAITEILLSNEKLQEQLGRLNEAIAKTLDPIVEALIPLFDALIEVLQELKPVFEAIADVIRPLMPILRPILLFLKQIAPALEKVWRTIQAIEEPLNNLSNALVSLTGAVLKLVGVMSAGGGGGIFGGGGFLGGIFGGRGGGLFGGGGGGFLGGGGGGGALGFASGGMISKNRMLDFPGASPDEGLIRAHVGERVVSNKDQSNSSVPNMTFNINAINPEAQKEEIFQIIEEGLLTRRLVF